MCVAIQFKYFNWYLDDEWTKKYASFVVADVDAEHSKSALRKSISVQFQNYWVNFLWYTLSINRSIKYDVGKLVGFSELH